MTINKSKICFFMGGRETGGMAFSSELLIRGINRDRFELIVLACTDGTFSHRMETIDQNCDILGSGPPPVFRRDVGDCVKRCWAGYLKMPFWIFYTAFFLAKYIRNNKIDLVHSSYYHYHIVTALACKLTHCKCVLHWRGVCRYEKLLKIAKLIRRLTFSFVWSIPNSLATFESIKQFTGDHITLVYNGLEIKELPRDRVRLREILGLDKKTNIVGLVATLLPLKGHIYFIEAAVKICAKYPDVHFVYIGGETASGQKEYLELLLIKIKQLNLENRVHFLGWRSDTSELVADFDIATVCTLPPGEGFGMVIIEAMAQSVPVITTNEGAAPEIITDGETGILIPSADSDALAQAIEDILINEDKRKTLGSQGYRECLDRFDIKKTVKQVEQVYENVLSMSGKQ